LTIEGIELDAVVLPVEFERAPKILMREIENFKPEIVIAFGQAEGRTSITPEKIAINLDNARIADNAGDMRKMQTIDPEGSDGYFTTLPVEEIIEALKNEAIPAELSLSAGTFVCNHLFYVMQKALQGTSTKSGFVHVPLLSEQRSEFPGQPTMTIDELIRGARTVILSAL
jgi:pyroglutamyl-peptidase